MVISAYLIVAQWAFLVLLTGLIVILYRQLGRLFQKRDQPTARSNLSIGTSGSGFQYLAVRDGSISTFTPGQGQTSVLAFVEPTCPACERLVGILGDAYAANELDGVRVLLLISEPPRYLQIAKAFQASRLEIGRLTDTQVRRSYGVSGTPFLVVLDETATVRFAAHATDRDQIRAELNRCRLPLGSQAVSISSKGDVRSKDSDVGAEI